MKKSFISIIMPYIILFLLVISFVISSVAIRVDKWSVIEKEDISPAFVFYLYLHSWEPDTEYLQETEFLLGDVIDYCNINIIKRKPTDLEINPERIKFISPSKKIYEANLTGSGDYFKAGKFTRSKEDVLVILNESGIWSIDIMFDNEAPLSLISTVDFEIFANNSEIHIFYGTNINVYTNLEYQQLRVAKALEESTEAAEDSRNWAIASTIALSIAAIIAAATLYHNYRIKRREIKAECKLKVGEGLLDIRYLIEETINFLDKVESNNYEFKRPRDYQEYDSIQNKFIDLRQKLAFGVTYALSFPELKDLSKKIDLIFLCLTSFNNKYLKKLRGKTSKGYVDSARYDLKELEQLIKEFLVFTKI